MKVAHENKWPAAFTAARAAHAAAYEAFQAAAWALPIARREQQGGCGDWTPREVICHAAGWEVEAQRRLRAIAADPATPDQPYDDDRFNAAQIAARRHLGWVAALADLGVAHAALRAFLRTITPVSAGDPRFAEWLDGRASDFDEHAAQLRDWR